jgi:hypothetical protein
MRLIGHRSERTYQRYSVTSETDLAEGLERVARQLAGGDLPHPIPPGPEVTLRRVEGYPRVDR